MPEDLVSLDDLTLIDTCARVELLSDVNRERLRHVNYMRKSRQRGSSKPKRLTGQEMIAWLSIVSGTQLPPARSCCHRHETLLRTFARH